MPGAQTIGTVGRPSRMARRQSDLNAVGKLVGGDAGDLRCAWEELHCSESGHGIEDEAIFSVPPAGDAANARASPLPSGKCQSMRCLYSA